MIHNTPAIVLWSRRSREADKVVGLFTQELGRLTVRAASAARSTAKFAALTEPFVESDMAVYLAPGRGWGKIVGGRIRRSFPRLRMELERSTAAAWVCEVIQRLTPEEQRSLEKFELLKETLAALETAAHLEVVRLAFAIRFLSAAGFGLQNKDVWRDFRDAHPDWASGLEEKPLAELGDSIWRSPALSAVERLAGTVVTDHLARPLHVNRFRQMAGIDI
jgi:hypothetical protein